MIMPIDIPSIEEALGRREGLLAALLSEGTDCYRLFHGVSEGIPGLTIDRYGALVLVQTFREPLASDELGAVEQFLRAKLSHAFSLVYNHRGQPAIQSLDEWQCQEIGRAHV